MHEQDEITTTHPFQCFVGSLGPAVDLQRTLAPTLSPAEVLHGPAARGDCRNERDECRYTPPHGLPRTDWYNWRANTNPVPHRQQKDLTMSSDVSRRELLAAAAALRI